MVIIGESLLACAQNKYLWKVLGTHEAGLLMGLTHSLRTRNLYNSKNMTPGSRYEQAIEKGCESL